MRRDVVRIAPHGIDVSPANSEPNHPKRTSKTLKGYEVDFHVRYLEGGHELIQVCADLHAPETLTRELRALAAAAVEHSNATLRLLVLDRDQSSWVASPGVIVQPVYEWLLADESVG